MKLDTQYMRYLDAEAWRTLTAVETASKNHEVVPTATIEKLSGLRGGVHRSISALAKVGLIGRLKNASYDGYRLTYGGLVRIPQSFTPEAILIQ
jgi:RIO kinase 2